MTDTPVQREPLVQRVVRVFVTGPLSPLLLIVAAVAGLVAILATPREEDPQIVVPMADVAVSFPGASAEEVERLVATPLEKLLWQIRGVEHVYSISRRDGALVMVRFFVGEDRERALVRVLSQIEGHRDKVPPGVTGWVVRPIDIDDVPIVSLTLWSPTLDDYGLRRVAEELKARLDPAPDVSFSELIGGRSREVRAELDPDRLAAHGLSPLEVARALGAADAALGAGAFDRTNRRVPVRAGPFVDDARSASRLVVGAYSGRPVLLRDVAEVLDGPSEAMSYVRLAFGHAAAPPGVEPGRTFPAVTLGFAKKRGTNAVSVAEDIVRRARALQAEILPDDVHLLVTRNYGATANEKVNELLRELALAIVTVTGLIAFALGWREGLIVAAAVPITFALTLLVNLLAGYSINRVTLFALVLVLGLVCDDPIVDVENIHRHFATRKRPPLESVLVAVNEVRPPVIVATLAVILSFLPMLFITGMMGPYMRPMALNVPVAMAMSLLVAFTVTPWMAYGALRGEYGRVEEHASEEAVGRFARVYRRFLERFLESRRARWGLLGAILVLLAFAVALFAAGAIPLKLLPYDNKSELQLVIDMPAGTALEATDAVVRDFERYLATVPEITDFESYVGTASPIDFNGLVRRYQYRQAPEHADVRINLVQKERRAQQSHSIALRLRPDLDAIAARSGAKLAIVEVPPGPPVLQTLVAEVGGPPSASYDELIVRARALEEALARQPLVVDVDDFAEASHAQLDFLLDKEKAALNGVSTVEAARTLQLALGGSDATTVHEAREREPLRLVLRLDRAERSGATELGRVRVKGAEGSLVPLGELGSFAERTADQPIYHKDLARVVYVVGDVAGRPPVDVVWSMEDEQRAVLPAGFTANWGGEGEWNVTRDVFRDLGLAFAAALVGIFVLLVVETHSFSMPLIIMLAIPLAAIGIAPGFWLLNLVAADSVGGYPAPVWFTATAMIGMIALAGIVVRNSIILIDFIRRRHAEGAPLEEAILESGARRGRPILLTAGAAMLGAWPITLDPIFSGLAWSLIFGLVASTAFTLVVVPVAYFSIVQSERVGARS
ncbi:MAG: efflux RND transporter permease subunit [Thermodesulfobacteriota bacterium]